MAKPTSIPRSGFKDALLRKDMSDSTRYLWRKRGTIEPEEMEFYADVEWFEAQPDKFKIY